MLAGPFNARLPLEGEVPAVTALPDGMIRSAVPSDVRKA